MRGRHVYLRPVVQEGAAVRPTSRRALSKRSKDNLSQEGAAGRDTRRSPPKSSSVILSSLHSIQAKSIRQSWSFWAEWRAQYLNYMTVHRWNALAFPGTSPRHSKKMAAAQRSPLFASSSGFQGISMLLFWLLLLAGVEAQNQSSEVQTLLRFKSLMEAEVPLVITEGYWSTWNETDKTPCAWYGVTCTANFTVERLNFQAWGLKPSSLGVLSNLSDLRDLDISRNDFILRSVMGSHAYTNHTIPDDIGTLTGLTYLDLSYSSFSGPIPSSISACRSLRYVYLQGNKLTGQIPNLSGLFNLQVLLLGQNQLSGPFPSEVGESSSLVHLELTDNSFNGIIPSLPNLTNLIEVYLDYNNFTRFEEPLFPGAKSLEHFTVKSNNLEGPIPPSITEFPNLKNLDMSDNQLTGHIPSEFSPSMNRGFSVDFSQNQLKGSIPSNLLRANSMPLANMPSLNFSYNLLTGNIPFDETKEYNYWTLDFSYNNLSGPIPSICNNGSSTFINFWLQNNSLSGDIVDFLTHCYGHMETLLLANNSFTGDLSRIVNTIFSSDLLMRELNTEIQIVDLSNNNLQMSVMEANHDPMRTMLECFVLNTSLTEFRIQGNNFSGAPLPAYLNSATTFLEVLDISSNNLKGEISDGAFNSTWFPTLQLLNLSHNEATGPIPEATVLLPNLVILDVVSNHLSGPLPALLPNRLYDPSFFAGNDGLCGKPLSPCPQGRGVQWWVLLIIVGGSMMIAIGSCFGASWRWRVYRKRHQQDADLIRALLERESTTLLSLAELKKATNNFAKSAQIGEGGFGNVYMGKLNGAIVAIKRSKREGSEKDKQQFLNEVKILSQVIHRRLVKLLGCCMENKIAVLVFEFVSNGTLQQHLKGRSGKPSLSWKHRLQIAVQVADALNYLHSAAPFPIYHRDVKSSNIMLDDHLDAKVTDFGISKLASLDATHVSTIGVQGTIGYIDPEYYTTYQLTNKSDVYSFGVVLLELISAKPVVDFERGNDEASLVYFAQPYIESGDLHELIDPTLLETYNELANNGNNSILKLGRLAMKCLHGRSKARPGMKEVWKDLQNLWLEFDGTSKALGSINVDDDPDPEHTNHSVFFSDTFSCTSSNSSPGNDATCMVQMIQYSHKIVKEDSE